MSTSRFCSAESIMGRRLMSAKGSRDADDARIPEEIQAWNAEVDRKRAERTAHQIRAGGIAPNFRFPAAMAATTGTIIVDGNTAGSNK